MCGRICDPGQKETSATSVETTGVASRRQRQSTKRLPKVKGTASLQDVASQASDPSTLEKAWVACLGAADFLSQDLVKSAREAVLNAPSQVTRVSGDSSHKSFNAKGNASGEEKAVTRPQRPCSARGECSKSGDHLRIQKCLNHLLEQIRSRQTS